MKRQYDPDETPAWSRDWSAKTPSDEPVGRAKNYECGHEEKHGMPNFQADTPATERKRSTTRWAESCGPGEASGWN